MHPGIKGADSGTVKDNLIRATAANSARRLNEVDSGEV
jgi:hypothetical protein